MPRPPPASTLFPYTTLFRSQQAQDIIFGQLRQVIASMRIEDINRDREQFLKAIQHSLEPELLSVAVRSEEHTSELQSRRDLVCRLLLEKKKKKKTIYKE